MTLPVYPESLPFDPLVDSWSWPDLYQDPLQTDMEGGNKRLRTRPGDDIGRVSFTIRYTKAQYSTFLTFVQSTLNRGTSRWTMDVWDGSAFITRNVQFAKKPVPQANNLKMDVSYDLWVYP